MCSNVVSPVSGDVPIINSKDLLSVRVSLAVVSEFHGTDGFVPSFRV